MSSGERRTVLWPKFSILVNFLSHLDFHLKLPCELSSDLIGRLPAPNPKPSLCLTARMEPEVNAYNLTEELSEQARRVVTKTNAQSTPSIPQRHDTPNNKNAHHQVLCDKVEEKSVT